MGQVRKIDRTYLADFDLETTYFDRFFFDNLQLHGLN